MLAVLKETAGVHHRRRVNRWVAVTCASIIAGLLIGCNPTTRHQVLTTFFDGVPPPPTPTPTPEIGQGLTSGYAGLPRRVRFGAHGPYAAKLCTGCHVPGTTNSLVVPREELCFRCHEFSLNKKYVHGPLASGGCTACHDPHSSQYRYLLVSESDSFCFHCHEREVVARVGAHAGAEEQCTGCHDPHMSDKRYLLR